MVVTRSQTRRSTTTTHTFHEQFPLPSDEKSIRVLCIQPGVRGTTIEASLSKIDLNDPERAPYTALSYTWGDAAIVDYILVNDEKMGVGANLFQALQHIRSPDEPIVIWVDAICIDQTDNIEKSHQVSHMDLVYRLCDQAYIWLGSPDDSNLMKSNPFALVEHLAADKHLYELPGYYKDKSTATWTIDSIWEGFELVARSPWWHRAWTVQEAVLPDQAVVICGSWRTPWESFKMYQKGMLSYFSDHTDDCCHDAYQALGASKTMSLIKVADYIQTLEGSRRAAPGFKTFSEVSLAYICRQCSNPLDKIYSLLGLSDSSKIELYPDYTKEVSEVYVEAFCKMLEEAEMSPRCLLGGGFNSERFNLPSWVRDFSAVFDPRPQLRRTHVHYHLFKTCGDLSGKLEVKDRKHLLTHGILIDRVKAVAMKTYIWESRNIEETVHNWRRTCEENGVSVRTDEAIDAFAKVLCGGVIYRGAGPLELLEENDVDLPTDSEWSDFWATGNWNELSRGYRTACTNALDQRILYITFSGRIGLSLPNVKVGDEIWVIHGSDVPFILRRQSETPAHHRLVGDTYLHGVMHGSCARREDSVEVVLV
ncbi:unnamed protein product [Alternaria alternata]|jgi:hypothetical protein|uniref:Heterokaryon incompatibility domain-containing protein n=1 Tax=Alternaria tenuissima TaxID=119927 RepID=A0A4Q4ME05_9PLEO|nr:HET-like protein [Alternaria alternata]RYN49079.1 hypothetical protein AA0114_g6776 [Alternaria tenuissima]